MSRNPITFIFNLGKHHPLRSQPFIQLNAEIMKPSTLLPIPLIKRKTPVKVEQVQHTNQMSS